MPNTERQWARREIDRAAENLNWAGTHLNRVEERYRALHPEIADPLIAAMQLISVAQEGIEAIKGKI